jgi:hypothetical protein
MRNSGIGDRLIALFLFGLLAFSPPALVIFNVNAMVAGLPVLFVYLFGTWIALVALVTLMLRPRESPEPDGAGEDAEGR